MKLDYERIILWVLVILMFIRLFVIREKYVASTPPSIMDLAEFRGVPDDVKQIWSNTVVSLIMPSVGAKITEAWNGLTAPQKQTFTTESIAAATQLSTNIQSAPVTFTPAASS